MTALTITPATDAIAHGNEAPVPKVGDTRTVQPRILLRIAM